MRELVDLVAILIIFIIIIVALISPLFFLELRVFNELNDTHYTAREWFACCESIKLQYAGKKSLEREEEL